MTTPEETYANWVADARAYVAANIFCPDPLLMAVTSVLSDVQEEIARGLVAEANFHLNVAKVLLNAPEIKAYAETIRRNK